MYNKNLDKDKAIKPGSVILKQMKFYRYDEAQLAKEMGISKKQLESIISGETKISKSVAAKLEKVLVLPVDFWLNLEELYEEKNK